MKKRTFYTKQWKDKKETTWSDSLHCLNSASVDEAGIRIVMDAYRDENNFDKKRIDDRIKIVITDPLEIERTEAFFLSLIENRPEYKSAVKGKEV